MNTPKVTLLSHTNLPLETVMSLWNASKNELDLQTPEQIKATVDPEEVRKLFRDVIAQHIPVGESIDFVFMIEHVSVSWREQAVRHRIGVKPSLERLGADIGMVDVKSVSNIADSVWWSQSMRIQSMGQFATQGNYRVPDTVLEQGGQVLADYVDMMKQIEDGYNKLVAAGIPMEDARELIPLGATHRISWKLNISALQHIVSKRGCWILQIGIWGPVIQGMITELATKIDPIFGELVTPPCLKGDDFTKCVYMEENRRRYTGDDALPPCPLHLVNHYLPEATSPGDSKFRNALPPVEAQQVARDPEELARWGVPMAHAMVKRAEEYRKFWGRDPYNGRRLRVLQ